MSRFFKLALGCLIFAGMAVAAKAENPSLYVWADSLTLYAAPSFSAPAIGELAYGTAVEPLAAPGPLIPGGGAYPAMRRSRQDPTAVGPPYQSVLHGHWLKLRSRVATAQEGYAFDTSLLPLPAPRCEPGRESCEPFTSLRWAPCPDGAKLCESVDDYSARVFGLLSQDRDDRAGVVTVDHYRRNVLLEVLAEEQTLTYVKRWMLPMVNSIEQAYVIARRFYGDCFFFDTFEPPRKIDLGGCPGNANANVVLSLGDHGAVIDWGFMD
jgi:hypothetical protein